MTDRLFEPDVMQCPYPSCKKLQAKCAVYQVPEHDDLFLVLGDDDVVDVLGNPEVFSSRAVWGCAKGSRRRPRRSWHQGTEWSGRC
jgi:hypothetical protein